MANPPPHPAVQSRRSWVVTGLVLLLMVAVGGWLRADHLETDSFDEDELYAVRITGVGWIQVGSVIARDGLHTNHPPLMSVPFLGWTAAFGTSEGAVRSLPCIASTALIPMVFLLGYQLGGRAVGLIAGALVVVNPLNITFAQESRQYALLTLLVCASHSAALWCLREPRWRAVIVYVLVTAFALLTHYFAGVCGSGPPARWRTIGVRSRAGSSDHRVTIAHRRYPRRASVGRLDSGRPLSVHRALAAPPET
jgi:hypothetical protein